MKILLVNNFFYNRGGDCTYFFALKNLLEKKGHKVIVFSMHHPQNFDSEYSKYFVSYINYPGELESKSISSGLKVLCRSIYSLEAKKKIEALINAEKPEIAHLNNIRHHITTSIINVFKKYKIPVVWTLHDFQLICPNTSFLAKGNICERCKKRKYFWPPIVRCKKSSFLASSMAAVEHTFQWISGIYDLVEVFIAPSDFLRKKFIEYSFAEDRIVLLRYFTDIDLDNEEEKTDNYYLYVGRISEEKGIKTLIDSAVKVKSCKLKITGDGPILKQMITYAKSKDKEEIIEFLGHKMRKDLLELYKKCRFIVVPSEWYEVTGLVVLEAFAVGKTAIG
ncbi:MAG: glycosyltransferase, partial [Thermodesulfovibrionia bacterium]